MFNQMFGMYTDDIIALLISFLIPFVLTFLINTFFIKGPSIFHINYDKRVTKQPLLYLLFFTPICLFIGFGCLYWEPYTFNMSAQNVDKFFEISKVPLTLLGLLIPFLYTFLRVHASGVAERQIELTKQKNIPDLYMAHVKHITDTIEKIEKKYKNISIESLRLYRALFPMNSFRDGVFFKQNGLTNVMQFQVNELKEIVDCVRAAHSESLGNDNSKLLEQLDNLKGWVEYFQAQLGVGYHKFPGGNQLLFIECDSKDEYIHELDLVFELLFDFWSLDESSFNVKDTRESIMALRNVIYDNYFLFEMVKSPA